MITPEELRRKNRRVMTGALCFVAGMIALAYISVPLYSLFCKVTGFNGTTQEAAAVPDHKILDRVITIRFNADTARDMPWRFKPDLKEVALKVGQDGLITFLAENPTAADITGTAVYNVTPLQAGKYFYKTQCFCFGEQVLKAGEKVHMPVSFFIDPKIMDDREMNDVKTITLSYTFFRKDSAALEKAVEKFQNTP